MGGREWMFPSFLSLSTRSNETDLAAHCKQHDFLLFYVTDELHGLDSIEVWGQGHLHSRQVAACVNHFHD